MAKPLFVPLLAASLMLSACANGSGPTKEQIGSVIGAAVGIVVGSKIGGGSGKVITGAIGGLAGAWIGGEIARRLDERDTEMAHKAAEDSLDNDEAGEVTTWRNPDSGNSGSVTPTTDSFETADSGICRDFESTVMVDGESETAYGRACQQADGSWKILQ